MKRLLTMLCWTLAALLLFAACEKEPVPAPAPEPEAPQEEVPAEQPSPEVERQVLELRLVEGAQDGDLILAGETEVLSLSAGSCTIYLDGQPATPADLEDGMPLRLHYSGSFMETFPLQLGAENGPLELYAYSLGSAENPGGSCYDLCGLYLQVLEDLWAADEGLNSDIQYISLDLSQAPGGLTAGEKSALAWIFASRHGAEPLELSAQQLKEQGFLNESGGWDEGIAFHIRAWEEPGAPSFPLPSICFGAGKWRGPLGAYYFSKCSATWPEMGTWSGYQIGSEAIS